MVPRVGVTLLVIGRPAFARGETLRAGLQSGHLYLFDETGVYLFDEAGVAI
jgi:hypothetical protein